MRTDIEYLRDVVVGTVYQGQFRWYASEKEIWILDRVKWHKSFSQAGHIAPENHEDRFGIAIVDNAEVGVFLEHNTQDRVDAPHLQALLRQHNLDIRDEFLHLLPALYVNFDEKIFLSYFPEPTGFEKFVPDGWTSAYRSFFDEIPLSEHYWIIDNRDLLVN